MMYVLQVLSGEEQGIRSDLQRIGYTSFVPQEVRLEHSKGKWREQLRTVMPGYIFVSLPGNLTPNDYYHLQHSPGVVRILGFDKTPAPLTVTEERWVMWLCNGGQPLSPSEVKAGANITVLSGPLKGYEAQIIKVHPRQRRVDAEFKLFGRIRKITLSADVISLQT